MTAKTVKLFVLLIIGTVVVTVKLLRDVKSPEVDEPAAAAAPPSATPARRFLRMVHIDLKGAPPRMSYLESLLPGIRRAGGNGLLVEYEDMFPFEGRLRNVSSTAAYSAEEVRGFVAAAEGLGMEVVPLVQTFGHLEYVLKLEEFRHLREEDAFPQEICPARSEAVAVVKEMIRQIMEIHKNSKFIHIGCDEVRHLGKCPACARTNPKKIFSRHVYRIGSFVRATYPGVVPLIWDDMMRRWSIYDVQDSGLTSVVEPVVWVYSEDIPHLVPHYLWYIYFKSFPRVWAASAFKGSTGETEVVPNLSQHYENNLSWMKFIKNRKDRVDTSPDIFGGIILTGWSRYDHFALLCELLPPAIPSLMLNLVLASRNFRDDAPSTPGVTSDRVVFREWREVLRCPRIVPEGNPIVIKSREYQAVLGSCDFPGSVMYGLGFEYLHLKERLMSIVRKVEESAWASQYNFRKNFTSPWRVANILNAEFEDIAFKAVGLLKSAIDEAMGEFYEDFVVREWIEQNIDPIEERLSVIHKNLIGLMKRRVWPRRPLT